VHRMHRLEQVCSHSCNLSTVLCNESW
jgi:hypothetical protein